MTGTWDGGIPTADDDMLRDVSRAGWKARRRKDDYE